MKRSVYLEMRSLGEARGIFLGAFDWTALAGTRSVPSAEALGRVTAGPVFAAWSSPSYNGAAMDGFALRAEDTFGASDERPVRLALGTRAHPVNTGRPLPPGTDAVVMIEKVHCPDAHTVELTEAVYPWQHVRRVGEDIVARELLLPHHHRLGAADVAALMTAGVFRLEVLERPRVAIIATGTELVGWREAEAGPPGAGCIVETNSAFLAGLVSEAGGEPMVLPPVADDPGEIRDAALRALEGGAHMVVINAGASAGSEDHTVHVVGEIGQVLVHGVRAMPGKPTILGRSGDRPVVGAPGYPVSAWVCFDQFIAPALSLMQGQQPVPRETVRVSPARKLPSRPGMEEFLRVHLGRVGGRVVATPLGRGAGTITSLTRADGLLRIPEGVEGVDGGAEVEAELLGPRSALERTLVVVGSHDVTLDILADHMRRRDPTVRMSASNVGSHMGGTHLLDPDTGEYNVSEVRRQLAGIPARLVTLAHREQGLIVARGNPMGIRGLEDLARRGLVFVNRQAGSGTRVLLDHHLGRLGVDPSGLRGYAQEEYTHMAVAVHVHAGDAHAGMGIRAAANALGLDFIPVATERYDLCIPLVHIEDPRVRTLLATLETGDFRRAVVALGGYDVSEMGRTAWEG
jgi:putative molybdopterin biosynthesis protein